MKLTIDSSRVRERGTQIAEFAVALPLLVFLVLIVTEGAQFIRMHVVLNNVAREGARLATVPANKPCIDLSACGNGSGNDQTLDIVTAMQNYASYNSLPFPCSTSKKAKTCLQEVTAGDGVNTFIYVWKDDGTQAAKSWTCSSMTITINQGVVVNSTTIKDSSVQVNCGWQLQLLPRTWFGSSNSTVNLIGIAEFRNLY